MFTFICIYFMDYMLYVNKLTENPNEVSEVFNNYFSNVIETHVIPKLQNKSWSRDIEYTNNCNINVNQYFLLSEVTEYQVVQAIDSLNNKYSSGFDEVPSVVIKKSKMYLAKPLTHLINSSFVSGIFPQKLKIGKIKPVFKSGDPLEVSCYRPVSLLPTFSKIYERLVYNQLEHYLESNFLLDKEQHGFRVGKSVITAATDFIENIVDNVDKKKKILGMFLDLTKAFDSVCHSKLIETLKQLGFHNRSLAWFSSYLNNRKQFVEITHSGNSQMQRFSSSYRAVRYGVPQGSILGPLLFICHLRGLASVVPCRDTMVCLYADDTSLLTTADTLDLLEVSSFINLSALTQFFEEHNLLVNLDKTKLMQFSTKSKNLERKVQVFSDNQEVTSEDSTRFLGLIIDKNLDWTSHVDHVTKKLSTGLFVLRRMANTCKLEALKTIYFSLIQSHIQFGLVVYGSTNKSNLNKILKLQKQALRIMLSLKWRESVKNSFAELEIFTVYGLYIFESVMFAVNSKLVSRNTFNHPYNTRNHHLINLHQRHNLEFFKKKPSYMGLRFFGHLPDVIRKDYESISKFKNKLKTFLLEKAFYSLEEFFGELD